MVTEMEWRVRAAFQYPLLAKNVGLSRYSGGGIVAQHSRDEGKKTGRIVFEKHMWDEGVLQD